MAKTYTLSVGAHTEIRTLPELQHLLQVSLEQENYELCGLVQQAIDHYPTLVQSLETQLYETVKI